MEAGVVPPPHVLERRELDLFDGPPRTPSTDQLGLVETVHGLREGIDAPISVNSLSAVGCRRLVEL